MSLPQHGLSIVRQACGQALIEVLLMMPLLLFVVLALIQLIGLSWAQQHLQLATMSAARAGSLAHGQQRVMERTLVGQMALLNSWQRLWSRQTATQWLQRQLALQTLHFQRAAELQRITPDRTQLETFKQWRYAPDQDRWLWEVPIDQLTARLALLQSTDAGTQQRWLAARQLQIQVRWCLPLRVPVVNQLLAKLSLLSNVSGQSACRLAAESMAVPLMALTASASFAMESGFREGIN